MSKARYYQGRILIDFWYQNETKLVPKWDHEPTSTSKGVFSKNVFFLRKNNVFSKNRLSKITSISASILVPTWFHVALQNRRFSDFWRFQEAFKISSFFVSNFYRCWLRLGLQHGAILGAKTPQNSK